MNEPEQNFDALRKLLSLKQHEVPPPGYFNDFSAGVITRIRRGDVVGTDTLGSQIFAEAPWLLKLIQGFQAKPAYAGALASALCLLLVAGIVYTDNPGAAPEGDLMPSQVSESSSPLAVAPASFLAQSDGLASVDSSTNPVLSLDPGATTFGAQNPLFKSVDFAPASH